MASVTRQEFQKLSECRLREAKLLQENKLHSGAYYLAGYAIELAIKAIIARQFKADVFPDKSLANNLFVHDFQKLLNVSGISTEFDGARKASPELNANWAVIADWSPDARYSAIDAFKANSMIEAVSHETHGVLQWLKQHW